MKSILVVLDGCSWDYLANTSMIKIADTGTCIRLKADMPTLTNVNNASLVTGSHPSLHGITGNFCLDPRSGRLGYMESPSYLSTPTIFQSLARSGSKTVFASAKDKLRKLLASEASFSFSAEDQDQLERITKEQTGKPKSIYSEEASTWLLKWSVRLLDLGFDFVYAATSDFIPHMYPPEASESKRYVDNLYSILEPLLSQNILVSVIADHGMNLKTRRIDVSSLLSSAKIEATLVPTIRDRYVKHHYNLGGCMYVYLHQKDQIGKAIEVLKYEKGIQRVFTADEASVTLKLPGDRIGDLVIVGDKDTVFADSDNSAELSDTPLRSHGSLSEVEVPFLTNYKIDSEDLAETKDVMPMLVRQFTGPDR